jgi:hypothetical protein
LLIVAGLLLALVGAVAVALFYASPQFGSPEWEFGTIAQTFDALPLPTLGLVLLALGVRARGGSVVWTRSVAVAMAIVAVLCVAAVLLFALDIPIILRAAQRVGGGDDPQRFAAAAAGLKRGVVKVAVLALCYGTAYAWMARIMWRVPRG